ncbi:MAG: 2OG-Fe(II) oxygenase family protein, partial [Alphaproteobacteria bacterium]
IGASILRATAVSLGLAEDFFAKRYAKPIARTGLLYYPDQDPTRGDDQFGVAPHTDYGCLTVLSQDSSGGLQVMNKAGHWVEAQPIPGTFVIYVGDLLERWSNDRFTSTPHRVINRSGHARYSISHFYDPTYETVVDPRDAGLPAGMDSKYEPVLAGDYVLGRFDTTMAYRSKFKATA